MKRVVIAALHLAAAVSAQINLQKSFPNLIIPVNSADPNNAIGTQYSGHVAKWHDENGSLQEVATEIVFDNVPDAKADWCSIEFNFASPSYFTVSTDPIEIMVSLIPLTGSFVTEGDTWNDRPTLGPLPSGTITITNGQATGSALTWCGEGKVQALVHAKLEDQADFDLTWFELNDPANGVVNGVTFNQWKAT